MRTIVICNLKGGVAKTATTVNLAAILARDYAKRVLVVDGDSQGNTTEFFGAIDAPLTLADALRAERGGADIAMQAIRSSSFEGVDILPGDDSLMDLDLTKVELQSVSATVLRELVDKVDYDFCIIDMPPAFNAASAAALLAADEVIIPIKLDAFAIRGMVNLMRQIQNMTAINPRLKVAGCLPTMWYKSETMMMAETALRGTGLRVFPHIRRTDKVDEMTFAQEPLLICSPKSAAGVDYRRFVSAYLREV